MDFDDSNWVELRCSGKLPERRSNHTAWVATLGQGEFLYIHGGRDLKEGPVQTMWRLNLTETLAMENDASLQCCWESVKPTGKGPKRVSYHDSIMISPTMVAFYGGLYEGNEDCNTIWALNLEKNAWSQLSFGQCEDILPRDDFALATNSADMSSFYIFGGFVKGSRVEDLIKFTAEGTKFEGDCIIKGDEDVVSKMPLRASTSAFLHQNKIWVFGGQDDDNNKLNDLWCCDLAAPGWSQVSPTEGEFWPCPRSGHTSVMWNDKMYLFGGIFELTKELGDLCVFDLKT